jgi:dihydrofolate reductase
MIGIIAAVSQNGVIGVDGSIPWNYPEDMRHFRLTTLNSVIIMGRKTFESIGKPLPKRKNIVISSNQIKELTNYSPFEIEQFSTIEDAFDNIKESSDIWFIGGAKIYEAAMSYADEIHLTLTPDIISHPNAVRFPWINAKTFTQVEIKPFEGGSELYHCIYRR